VRRDAGRAPSSAAAELEAFKRTPRESLHMSQATKVVLGTVGVAAIVAVLLLAVILAG
jgi:hypothetical protein